jgi:hypothetical protein
MLTFAVILLCAVILTSGQKRACQLRSSWTFDKASSCRGAYAYVKEGTGLILACPFGANTTHGLVLKSDSAFDPGPYKTARLAVAQFTAPAGSPLGAQPYVAFLARTQTGITMEGRMQNGATRFVSATFAKVNEPTFFRDEKRDILDDDRLLNVSLARGELDGQPLAARITVDSRTEFVQLDKQTWSPERFAVSVHLGVESGAVSGELSALVIAFGDNDGGGSVSLAGPLGCAGVNETTFPPTSPPTPAPTPAPTFMNDDNCVPGSPGCCKDFKCVLPTITCAANEALSPNGKMCGCEIDFTCKPRMVTGASVVALSTLLATSCVVVSALM